MADIFPDDSDELDLNRLKQVLSLANQSINSPEKDIKPEIEVAMNQIVNQYKQNFTESSKDMSLYEELLLVSRLQESLNISQEIVKEATAEAEISEIPGPSSAIFEKKHVLPGNSSPQNEEFVDAQSLAVVFLAESVGPEIYCLSPFFKIRFCAPEGKMCGQIVRYIENSQCHLQNFRMNLQQIYKIRRYAEVKLKTYKNGVGWSSNRMMLWHGTATDGLLGILKHGIVKPIPSGQMFGNGIYFADRSSKSAQYCGDKTPGSKGFLLLCDVELGGNIYETTVPHNNLTQAPKGFTSVKGIGKNIPSLAANEVYKGSILPAGGTQENSLTSGTNSLQYNEYIVYDSELVNLKFLIEFEFI